MKDALKILRKKNLKQALRMKRKLKVKKHITGTGERPRLSVYRSLTHTYAQAIDDVSGMTLAAASTMDKDFKAEDNKMVAAKLVGTTIAERLKEKKIESVVFDRNGFKYTGRVSALADAAREAGLKI